MKMCILNSYVIKKAALKVIPPMPLCWTRISKVEVWEIAVEVDDDPRACYFKQAKYGKFIRMALILKLLEIK